MFKSNQLSKKKFTETFLRSKENVACLHYELTGTKQKECLTLKKDSYLLQKAKPIKFKHFTRKGYALFSCIHKEIIIGTLSVATLTHAKADGISVEIQKANSSIQNSQNEIVTKQEGIEANKDDLLVYENWPTYEESLQSQAVKDSLESEDYLSVLLDEVGILGSRSSMPAQAPVRQVTILEEDKINLMAVESVNDVLKNVLGVDVRQRGPLGAQTDIGIRGGTSEHVALLLDGINICDPQTAHNAMDLPIDISEVERILITKGPAALSYGASSLSGAINIISKEPRQNRLSLRLEAGSFGYASLGMRLALGKETFGNSLSLGYSRSDGYLRSSKGNLNSDFEGFKTFYRGRYESKGVLVAWHAGISLKGWGSNTFYSVLSDEQYERTVKYFTAIRLETRRGKVRFFSQVYWNRFHDRYEFYRGNEDASPYNYNRTDIFGLALNAFTDWFLGRTVMAIECRNEWLRSGNLGEPLKTPIPIKGTSREYTLGLNRTNLSLSLEHNLKIRWFDMSLGIVAIKNSLSDMPIKLYPSINVSYSPFENFRIFASYDTSLRMPSYTELYYSVDGHKADKHLKPEQMFALEIGASYLFGPLDIKLSLFRNQGNDMIDWIMDTTKEDAEWESVNHARIITLGAEISFNLDFKKLIAQQTVLKDFEISYAYLNQNQKKSPYLLSLYALEYLRSKFTSSLGLELIKRVNLNINCRYQSRIGSYTDKDQKVHSYKPYFITDVHLSYDKPLYTVYFDVNNLFCKKYVDYGNVVQPRMWVTIGARYNINL